MEGQDRASESTDDPVWPGRVRAWLEGLVIVGGVFFLGEYLLVAFLRIGHPVELEWMEGGVVQHVARVLEGKPLFVAPTLEYTPYLYTPLFYWVSALPAAFLGVGFLPLRLVSLFSSLVSMALIFRIVHRETGRWKLGVIASGFFAACYEMGGAWYDVGRVDSFFLALLLFALYALRFGGAVSSGLLVVLAAWAKQPALTIVAPILGALLYIRGLRFVFVHGAVLVAFFAAPLLLWHITSEGWSTYYLIELAGEHPIVERMIGQFWSRDLLGALPVPLVVGLAGLMAALLSKGTPGPGVASDGPGREESRARGLFWLAVLAGVLGSSWLSRMHSGGAVNVLFPVHAVLSIVLGLALAELPKRAGRARHWLASLLLMATAAQLWTMTYDPWRYVPTDADRAAAAAFLEAVAAIEGEVYLPEHGHLAVLAGKRRYSHSTMLLDVLRAENEPVRVALEGDVRAAIQEQRFEAIVLHPPIFPFVQVTREMQGYYEQVGPFLDEGVRFGPLNLERRVPMLYRPIDRAAE